MMHATSYDSIWILGHQDLQKVKIID